MKKMLNWLLDPPIFGPAAILWIRLMAGGVFFWEGILKFVYPNQGAGRFTKLGFPLPELTAHVVATTEIIGGLLLLAGLLTRVAALWFIGEMIVAILTTKIAVFLGTSPLPLPPALPKTGFWAVLHEVRSDYAQLLSCVFLLLEGPGLRSLDNRLRRFSLPAMRSQKNKIICADESRLHQRDQTGIAIPSPVPAQRTVPAPGQVQKGQ